MTDLEARIHERLNQDWESGDLLAHHADAIRYVVYLCRLGDEANNGMVATKAVRQEIADALGVLNG